MVDGQSIGDKRNRDHVIDAERQQAKESINTGDETEASPPTQSKVLCLDKANAAELGMAVDSCVAEPAPTATESTPAIPAAAQAYAFGSAWQANAGYVQLDRKSVLRQLNETNKKQASERQARSELVHEKSKPY